jgi:beta-mannosidase
MRTKILLLFIAFTSIIGCSKITKDIPVVQEINSNWEFKSSDSKDWRSASVPGNVYTDLLNHKLISDPFIKTNEEKVQWVATKNWEYKTIFNISDEELQKEFIELTFEGLDTYAKVFVNNQLVITTNNAFRTYSVDIKEYAKKVNEIRIEFSNTDSIETKKEKVNPYKLPEGKRIYTRKAQFQYGWDWGPKLNTSGIWKEVKLKTWNAIQFDDIYIKQQKVTSENANFEIEFTIESHSDTNANIFITANKQSYAKHIKIKKGRHIYMMPFNIKSPKLWWTHNLGAPYLYRFDFQLIENSVIKDKKSIKKGIRTIKLITEKDDKGTTFHFELNGVPVYMKGANYIPQNSFQNKVTGTHYEKLLSDVTDSNMNMLRVWGGGIYENDIFYDLCDEKGILVWQDFMFACAMYPGDKEFLANIKQEAIEQVTRLRNHSSIALWCGNNENAEGWNRWGWQGDRSKKEKDAIWKDYQAVFADILPKTVANLNSEINYWESSPKYGRGNPKYEFEGDAHDWWVWHDATPFEHFEEKVPRFMSEYGFQSFPSTETINYINQSETIDLKTDAIKSHQKHSRGFQLIKEYMQRDYNIPTNDADYAYVSQLLQAKGMTMGIEAHRRAKPYNMGTLFWQLNDCWPAISWSSIDYFGNWKALQYKAKKSFENVLISSILKDNIIETSIVNDELESLSGNLQLQIIDFAGKEIWSKNIHINVGENISTIAHTLDLNYLNIDKSNIVLVARFNNASSLFYLEKPKNLKLLKGAIDKTITKIKTGFTITFKSEILQKDIFLSTKSKGHFSDNFFDLLPNQEVRVQFKTSTTSLDDLVIKSLNSLR